MRKSGYEFDEINTAKAPLTEAAVRDLVARAGSVAAVLNTRHATAKASGWATSPPTAAAFARAVVADVNLLRRPILVVGDRIIIGFDQPAYAKLARR